MSFWKAGIGGMIGFTLGGPIGGIIGAIIGSKLSDNQPRPSNNQQNQAAFFTALFACFAKIAKADGIVTREEVDKVDLLTFQYSYANWAGNEGDKKIPKHLQSIIDDKNDKADTADTKEK